MQTRSYQHERQRRTAVALTIFTLTMLLVGLAGCGGSHSSGGDTSSPKVTLNSINVTSSAQAVSVNGTGQFTATGAYSDGTSKDLTTQAVWKSSSTSVASVTATGLATGLTSGTTTISASMGGVSGSKVLTVNPILSSISVTPADPTLTVNTIQQFSATGTWSDGSAQDLTDQVTWASSDSLVASVDNAGLATTAQAGTATISASLGTITGSDTLTVTAPSLTSILVTPAHTEVPQGVPQPFVATGVYSDGSTQQLASVTWESSNANVVAIDSTGLATTLAIGTVTINASSGSVTGSASFTVLPAALVSISLNPSDLSLALGNTAQIAASGSFTDGSTQDLTGLTWTSLDNTVATVDGTGFVSTVATGSTTISASSGSVTGSATLAVTSAVISSITVTPSNPSVPAGVGQQFTATGTFSDGSTQDVTDSATWTSSVGSVATISNSGMATTYSTGSATITASLGSVSGSSNLQVTNAALQSIDVALTNLQMTIGSTAQLTATGSYSDGSTQDLTSTVTWTSNPGSIVSLSNSGLVTAQRAGTTTITATLDGISGSTTATVAARVLQSLVVTPADPSATVGQKFQFTATAYYADGSSQDLSATVHWSTSAASIATINSGVSGGGLATAKAKGTVTITATISGVSGSTTLTIN